MYLVVKDKGINIFRGVFGYLWMFKLVVYRFFIVSRILNIFKVNFYGVLEE